MIGPNMRGDVGGGGIERHAGADPLDPARFAEHVTPDRIIHGREEATDEGA